jgi:hypothetical protein
MNKPLLRKVAKRIKENPEKYDQLSYCDTRCCIAGHAALIIKKPLVKNNQGRVGQKNLDEIRKTLGLSQEQWRTTCSMAGVWPQKFREAYFNAGGRRERAQVAHDRILHLIKTGE